MFDTFFPEFNNSWNTSYNSFTVRIGKIFFIKLTG